MNTQDIIKIGHKARIETEAFINRYINDEAKRWPIICHCGQAYTGYHPALQVRKSGMKSINSVGQTTSTFSIARLSEVF